VGYRDEAGARRQQRLEGGEVEFSGVVGRRDQQLEAEPVAQHLPRYDVRVVLDIADDDLVAGLQVRRPPALGYQVDRLGGAAQEHDLALVGRIEKPPHLLARRLEMVGRALAQLVDAAMHIGVVAAVELGDAVDDLARLLRAGAGIQEHQPGIALEYREFAA
jgi:hypothetical protein